MPRAPRLLALTSTLALGVALGLQPLSIDLSAFALGTSLACASSSGGNKSGDGSAQAGRGKAHQSAEKPGFFESLLSHFGIDLNGGKTTAESGKGKSASAGSRSAATSKSAAAPDSQKSRTAKEDVKAEKTEAKAEKTEAKAEKKDAKVERKEAEAEKQAKPERTASLGRMSPAHASAVAMERASPNSSVGQLAAYKDAVTRGDIPAASAALAGIANKGITERTVTALNALLGVSPPPSDKTVTEIATQAQELQQERAAAPKLR